MVKHIAMGMDKLSSANPKEIFSTIAPTAAAIIPIKYSTGRLLILGVNKTTMLALIKNASVPSRLFARNLCFPNFLPINAADESLIIRMTNPVMKKILGKMTAQIKAEIKT